MHEIIDYIVSIVGNLGYTGIFIMMVLESSFFPFPSEVAMIPAGYLASTGKMSFSLALLVGTFGALVGATVNYLLGYYLGGKIIKSLIQKYGKYFFIKEEHYSRSEKYFSEHGVITTFLARFITVIRQLISLPAGVFKMNFAKFFFYTGLGAGLWNLALMIIGYIAGENSELIAQYSKELLIGGIALILIIGFGYYLLKTVIYENVSIWIAVNSDNKILLQDRTGVSKIGEKWASFGGKIEAGESKEQGLEREVHEELGLILGNKKKEKKVIPYKYLGRKTYLFWKYKKIITINYFISFIDLDIKTLDIREGGGAKYFQLNEIGKIGFVEKGKFLKKFKKVIRQELKSREKKSGK